MSIISNSDNMSENNMTEIYLDNSATTALSASVGEKMREASAIYGNPSSLHSAGLAAEKIVSSARKEVLSALGVSGTLNGQLVFTASGSEANNLALFGTAYAKKRRYADKIISTDSEHPSVENCLCRLEEDGFKVVRISTKGGVLDFDTLEKELDDKVLLVTMMLVNNETGAFYDIGRVFSEVKRKCPDAITHCDAVQGFLKVKFSPSSLGADLVTVSSHKIHGPKGAGALYVSAPIIKAKKLIPIILGGGQENGFRSGTENTIGIAGFGEAAREGKIGLDANIKKMSELRESIISKLSDTDIKFNIPSGNFAPHILNITLPDIKSETMLHFLSSRGVFVSSGSACSSHSNKPSRTLTAFGLSPERADSSLRISVSEYNTQSDIDALANELKNGISSLIKIHR